MSRNLFYLLLTIMTPAGAALAEVPRVAVDIAPVHSLVTRVMEGVGAPFLIVTSGASPHEYSLRPSQARALQEADVVFWVSREMTPWMKDGVETLATNAAVVELLETEGTLRLPFRQNALFAHGQDQKEGHDGHDTHGNEAQDHEAHDDGAHDHGHDDHDQEGHDDERHDHEEDSHHEHAQGADDPHAWLSLENGAHWLEVIAARLSDVDPENAQAYKANAQEGQAELDALKAEITELLDPVRGRNFIVFHDAYQYFETSFGLPASGAISMSDASDPSPARIARIQARVADQNVTCVLSEPQFNPGIINAVMEGVEVNTGVLDPLGADLETGAALYPDVMRNLARTLAGCL